MKRTTLFLCLLLPSLLFLSGCQSMLPSKEALKELGRSTVQEIKLGAGEKARSTQESVKKGASAVARSAEDFTPEQEYFIGRSVAAVILAKYAPYSNRAANDYLNLLGQTLAQASDLPEIFRGYRVQILNSDEINAFATPGGHILITRGLLRCCPNEDSVAAVLAHEIGHIQLKHGIQAIKKARIADAVSIIATESIKVLSPVEISQLTETFSGAIADISNVISNGYSRSLEYDADDVAQTILRRVGYDPNALVEMLQVMEKNLKEGEAGFAKTHPSPHDRMTEVREKIGGTYAPVQPPKERQARFVKALAKI